MATTKLRGGTVSPFVEAVAREVKAMMGRRDHNVTTLARAAGLPYDTLARCLRRERPFALDELEAIAEALSCPVTAFLVAAPNAGGAYRGTTEQKVGDRSPEVEPVAA